MRLDKEKENTRDFHFKWSGRGGKEFSFKAAVPVPLEKESLNDYAVHLCVTNSLPAYARDEMKRALKEWLDKETLDYYDAEGGAALERVMRGEAELQIGGGGLESSGSDRREGGEESRWREAWSRALELGCAEGIWAAEAELELGLTRLLREREMEMEGLRRREEAMLAKAVQSLHTDDSAQRATAAASKHFAHLDAVHDNYDRQIASLKAELRRELRHLITRLPNSSDPSALLPSTPLPPPQPEQGGKAAAAVPQDESYTIYLGAQLKTMHNLRLTTLEAVEGLCRRSGELPRRLQVALDLYGPNLSALVLLVPPPIRYHKTFRTSFYRVCEESLDLHFPTLDEQLEELEREAEGRERLDPGEVYITRHSCLDSVEVVFHLVVGEEVGGGGDMNSRHPAIAGLRHLIRLSANFHIARLALPLLLVDRLSEEHTVQWCLKRSELLLKCVKGFLMEGAGSGSHSYTLSFLLPPNTPPSLFAQLSTLLPQIYHLVGTKTQSLNLPRSSE